MPSFAGAYRDSALILLWGNYLRAIGPFAKAAPQPHCREVRNNVAVRGTAGPLSAGEIWLELRTEVLVAGEHGADGDQHGVVEFLLGDVTAGSGLEGAFSVDGGIEDGYDQHRQIAMSRADFPHEVEAGAWLEGKVHNDEVGAGGGDRVQSLLWGADFGTNREIGLVIDQRAQPAPHQGMRVDDEDPSLGRHYGEPQSLPIVILALVAGIHGSMQSEFEDVGGRGAPGHDDADRSRIADFD
jgi:hypothetical protein